MTSGPIYTRTEARRYLQQRRRRQRLRGFGMPVIVALFLFGAFALNLLAVQVPSASRAERAVEALGMTNAHVTHREIAWGALGGCKQDDVTKFTVKATDAQGQPRTIEVCAPLLGGYTIRG